MSQRRVLTYAITNTFPAIHLRHLSYTSSFCPILAIRLGFGNESYRFRWIFKNFMPRIWKGSAHMLRGKISILLRLSSECIEASKAWLADAVGLRLPPGAKTPRAPGIRHSTKPQVTRFSAAAQPPTRSRTISAPSPARKVLTKEAPSEKKEKRSTWSRIFGGGKK